MTSYFLQAAEALRPFKWCAFVSPNFSEKIQESARSFPGKQNSVINNNLTKIPYIAYIPSQRLDWAFPLRPLISIDCCAGLWA